MEDTKFKFENGRFVNRKTGEAIPDDEPVMLFRARDLYALKAIQSYHSMLPDGAHADAVLATLQTFNTFRREHPERVREPQA